MPRIKEQCDAAGVEVRYSSHRKGVTVSLYCPDWSRFGPGGDTGNDRVNGNTLVGLTKSERKVLELLQSRSAGTAPEVAELLGLSERTVRRAFSSLKSKGLLRRVGSDKTGYWEVQ